MGGILSPLTNFLFGKPDKVDYTAAAEAQGQNNLEIAQLQALLNNPNIIGPYGSQTYTGAPGERPTITQTLSPDEQAKLDAANKIQLSSLGILEEDLPYIREALLGKFGMPGSPLTDYDPRYAPTDTIQTRAGLNRAGPVQRGLDYSGAPGMPTADAGVRDKVSQSIYDQAARFLDPAWKQREDQLNSTLVNQGITRGSEAFNTEQGNFNLNRDAAYNDLANRAVIGGGDAMQQLFNMALGARQQGVGELTTQGQFANTAQAQAVKQLIDEMQNRNAAVGTQAQIASNQAGVANQGRQQQLQEYTLNRTMPIQMLNALLTGSQVNNPTFQPTTPTSIQPTPIMTGAALTGQQNLDQFNANMAGIGTLFKGFGAAFPKGFG